MTSLAAVLLWETKVFLSAAQGTKSSLGTKVQRKGNQGKCIHISMTTLLEHSEAQPREYSCKFDLTNHFLILHAYEISKTVVVFFILYIEIGFGYRKWILE